MIDVTEDIPLFHMTSMAGSGETMLLRDLSVHPGITVASELFDKDHSLASQLQERFKARWPHTISLTSDEQVEIGYKPGSVLLIKQGV
ncbi:MAG: hypothetical protein R3E50_15105 [Halioglobus sp.]